MNLSKKIQQIAPSETLAITQRAQELKKRGINVISFGAGEPDFDTPVPIKNAAKAALDEGFTKYTPVAGIPELRSAIADYIFKTRSIKYSPDEVIVTCGAKAAIFAAMQVTINPGEEVIVPAPYWVSYPEQIKLADGRPVIVQTKEENNFKITPDELERAITEKTKAIIINSPSNPVSCVYSRNELYNLLEICVTKNIAVIADEIYDKLVYDGDFASVISSHLKACEQTIYINGFSKSYSMTGWRVGFAAGPHDIIKAMAKYQGQLYTNITSFVQRAAITALSLPEAEIKKMVEIFKSRRNLIARLISEIPGLNFIKPEGAFYVFVNVKNFMGKKIAGNTINTSAELAAFLLDKAHVAVVHGSAFGAEGYIRLSFATSEENIREGVKRIAEALGQLN